MQRGSASLSWNKGHDVPRLRGKSGPYQRTESDSDRPEIHDKPLRPAVRHTETIKRYRDWNIIEEFSFFFNLNRQIVFVVGHWSDRPWLVCLCNTRPIFKWGMDRRLQNSTLNYATVAKFNSEELGSKQPPWWITGNRKRRDYGCLGR